MLRSFILTIVVLFASMIACASGPCKVEDWNINNAPPKLIQTAIDGDLEKFIGQLGMVGVTCLDGGSLLTFIVENQHAKGVTIYIHASSQPLAAFATYLQLREIANPESELWKAAKTSAIPGPVPNRW